MKILKFLWPLFVSILLICLLAIYIGVSRDFFMTLVATLIGVLLAFWLNYLFVLFSERENRKRELYRLLTLLRSELFGNQDDIAWLNEAIKSAINDKVIHDPICTKSISELVSNIHDETFYALQSAGWFNILENEGLFSEITSVYQGTSRLKSMVRFSGAGHSDLKSEEERNSNSKQYSTISATCEIMVGNIKKTISSLDRELLLLKNSGGN